MAKNNYLEHKTEVKYMDGCLEASKDWNWFLDVIEQSFDLTDIGSWDEYQRANPLRKVYLYFTRIAGIEGVELKSENPILNDIISIAWFHKGLLTFSECNAVIVTSFGKLLLLTVRLTALINAGNGTDYTYYGELFTRSNEFQLIDLTLIKELEDEVIDLSNSIKIDGFDTARKCLENNINEVFVSSSPSFIEEHKTQLVNVNCFNYQNIRLPEFIPWQESFLADMISIDIKDRKVIPLMNFGNVMQPDINRWTKDVINNMRSYFSSDVASFVLESIAFVMYGIIPSKTTIETHCKLYVQEVESLKDYEKISVSSYRILSYLFTDKGLDSVKKDDIYKQFILTIQSFHDPFILCNLSNDHFPLSKQQKELLNQYFDTLYKEIDSVTNQHDFLEYLRNPNVVKHMDAEYFMIVYEKFHEYTKDKNDVMTANIFYEYMQFLIEANAHGLNLNKNTVRRVIISVQKLWQDEYYDIVCSNMKVFEYKETFRTSDIDGFNEVALKAPLLLARSISSLGEKELIQVMDSPSSHPFQYIFKNFEISRMYPILRDESHFKRNEIDTLIIHMINRILENRGYKFLNVLSPEQYLMAMYSSERVKANHVVSFIGDVEKELYERIEQETNYTLIEYNQSLTIAHVTQLFPILEQLIRNIGSMTGYVPFQINDEHFMKYKDSSSILIEILKDIYKESSSLESAPDILMTFNYMYNGNSLNVRNECIHGRNYQSGDSLRFAFRITLLVLNTLIDRLHVLIENK